MRKKIQYIVTIPGGECWIKAYSASEAIKEEDIYRYIPES